MHLCRSCEKWKPYHEIKNWSFTIAPGRGVMKRYHICKRCHRQNNKVVRKRYRIKLKIRNPEKYKAQRRAAKKRYYEKYPDRRNAERRRHRERNQDKLNANQRKWYANLSKEEKRKRKEKYRKKCLEQFGLPYTPNEIARRREYSKQYQRNGSKKLADWYVTKQIIRRSILTREDIPEEFIAAKREHLKLKRLLRERRLADA